MEHVRVVRLAVLYVVLVLGTLVGCASQPAAEGASGDAGGSTYAGALDLAYEGALDVQTQLALGTLRLEGTEDAVTREQAAVLLPLWQALAGSALKGEAERSAVLRQIEGSMAEAQVAAIAGMRLTAQDSGTWTQTQAGNAAPGGQGQAGRQGFGTGQGSGGGQDGTDPQVSDEARATRRAQFQTLSPEQRATMQAQFGQGGMAGAGRPAERVGAAGGPLAAVIALLQERAGIVASPDVARQRPTRPLAATEAPTEAPTATPAAAPIETPAATPTWTPTTIPTAVPTAMSTGTPIPVTAGEAAPGVTPTVARAPAQALYVSPALEERPDTDPGPPLVVEVSANRAYPDPLVAKSQRYLVSGVVRNESSETYALSALHVTFFDAEGFRGSYRRFPGPYNMGGEWIWHGRTEADVACLLLTPGQECPFIVEITAQEMASVLIHPDASATERQSVPLEASGLRLARDGTRYVTLSGQVVNAHPFPVRNVALSCVLLDAAGEIVSLGSAYVVGEGIEPGQAVDFEIRIQDSAYRVQTPFASYRVYAQAERD